MKVYQTTIYDIARELGISKSTVSRALNNHPEVSEKTKSKVLKLAKRLDYQRNMQSVNLLKRKSNLIGIIVPEFNTSFFPQVLIGAQEEAAKHGYNIIISQSNEHYQTEVDNSRVMLESQVDGILISLTKETKDFEHLKTFQRKGIPIVLFNRVCNEIIAPKVVINDYEAAFGAVEHLIQTGRKRIAHFAGPDSLMIYRKRLKGYVDALKKYNIPLDETLIIPYELSLGKVQLCMTKLMGLDYPPDGLFVFNDPTAIQIIQTVKEMGIQIPSAISIIGFSNDYGSELIEPGLSTIAQPRQLMGTVAMHLLLEQVDKDSSEWKSITKTLDSELIIRSSSSVQKTDTRISEH